MYTIKSIIFNQKYEMDSSIPLETKRIIFQQI